MSRTSLDGAPLWRPLVQYSTSPQRPFLPPPLPPPAHVQQQQQQQQQPAHLQPYQQFHPPPPLRCPVCHTLFYKIATLGQHIASATGVQHELFREQQYDAAKDAYAKQQAIVEPLPPPPLPPSQQRAFRESTLTHARPAPPAAPPPAAPPAPPSASAITKTKQPQKRAGAEPDEKTVVIRGMLTALELEREWLSAVFGAFGKILDMTIQPTPTTSPGTPAVVSIRYAELSVARYVVKCYRGETLTGIPIDVQLGKTKGLDAVGEGVDGARNTAGGAASGAPNTKAQGVQHAASLDSTVVIRGVLLDLDKAFLTEIFELFGTILKMDIREPGAASSPPAGKVRGPGAEKIMSNQATVTIMYADAKAAEDVIKSYNGETLCGATIEIYLASEEQNRKRSRSDDVAAVTRSNSRSPSPANYENQHRDKKRMTMTGASRRSRSATRSKSKSKSPSPSRSRSPSSAASASASASPPPSSSVRTSRSRSRSPKRSKKTTADPGPMGPIIGMAFIALPSFAESPANATTVDLGSSHHGGDRHDNGASATKGAVRDHLPRSFVCDIPRIPPHPSMVANVMGADGHLKAVAAPRHAHSLPPARPPMLADQKYLSAIVDLPAPAAAAAAAAAAPAPADRGCIGLKWGVDEGGFITVASVRPGSAAFLAGIVANDTIVGVNGVSHYHTGSDGIVRPETPTAAEPGEVAPKQLLLVQRLAAAVAQLETHSQRAHPAFREDTASAPTVALLPPPPSPLKPAPAQIQPSQTIVYAGSGGAASRNLPPSIHLALVRQQKLVPASPSKAHQITRNQTRIETVAANARAAAAKSDGGAPPDAAAAAAAAETRVPSTLDQQISDNEKEILTMQKILADAAVPGFAGSMAATATATANLTSWSSVPLGKQTQVTGQHNRFPELGYAKPKKAVTLIMTIPTAKAEKDRKNPHGISFMKPNAAKKLQGCKFGTIFVESVKQGSPACRAGIKAGDNIIRVNDWCGGKKSQSQPLHPEEDGAANTARLRQAMMQEGWSPPALRVLMSVGKTFSIDVVHQTLSKKQKQKQKQKIPPRPGKKEKGKKEKGKCAVCTAPVLASQERVCNLSGGYTHVSCIPPKPT